MALTDKLTAIADAIRAKDGTTGTMTLDQMPEKITALSSKVAVEWHQCPEAVRNYLANVTYDPSDYSTSQIDNYAPATAVVSNYKPIGQTAGGVTHYNEVPNTPTPFASGGKAGTLKPLDTLRWIRTTAGATAWNVRDLGGWACDGGTVKYGLLFRGGKLAAEDRAVLVGELGVQHDLDLRGREGGGAGDEPEMTESPLGNDVWYTRTQQYAWYALTPVASWQTYLRCVIDAVTHREPVYFHCTAGADRTGTLACVLEGLLGMSQSDIDKDYELTCFYSGTGTDANARRRNETDWTGLITEINGLSGSTFRDKCVNFVASLGFTAEEINAYRAAMIDGTPDTITLDVATYSVTKSIGAIETDNTATTAVQYQPYEAELTAPDGYAISDLKITMGGVDITATVFKGQKTTLNRKVVKNLTNCSLDNARGIVIDGQGYVANLTADEGFTLEGATVTITMGGVDMSAYYSEGKIAIPNVTGDIVITATAVETVTEVNKMVVQESNLNKRISGTSIVSGNGCFVAEPIAVDITKSCTVKFKGFAAKMGALHSGSNANYGNSKVALLDSGKNILAVWYIGITTASNNWSCPINGDDCVGDLATIFDTTPTAGTSPTASEVAYVQFAPNISPAAITRDSLSGLEILMAP